MTGNNKGKIGAYILAVLAILFSSCASGNGENGSKPTDTISTTKVAEYDHSLVTGKVIDSVICKSQSQLSYALYLPSYYSPEKKYPCIFFFDAHARGTLPLRNYKDIAEKYGFVFVGSNTSKNGVDPRANHDGIMTMMADARGRINIDPKRVFTAGFSGGSRWACSVANEDGGIAGVIGCGAGFIASNGIANKFYFFGIVGDSDFNYIEMAVGDRKLEQVKFNHQLLTFNGTHRWAPAADFEFAVQWMMVNEMKAGGQPKNDTLIRSVKNNFDVRVSKASKSGELMREYQLLAGAATLLEGLADMASFKQQLKDLESDNRYIQTEELTAQLEKTEYENKGKLLGDFPAQNETYWTATIKELRQKAAASKIKQESLIYIRLINYLGLLGYMHTNHELNTGDLSKAEQYLKIFKLADPNNPDCSYLRATLMMKKGDKDQAFSALSEAAALGYSDVVQLVNDPVLGGLSNHPGFGEVLKKIKDNYAGK
jgi:hypothetical protein